MSRRHKTVADLQRLRQHARYTDDEIDEFARIDREEGHKAAAEAIMRATLRYAFPEASNIGVTAIPMGRKVQ